MTLTQDEITKRLLQARKLGETPDWATIGKDPDTAGNPFQAQLDTGETNVVYATVVGNPDPQIIYYDPSCDLRLLQYGARVELEWRNGKAWVKGADKEFLTQQQAGTPLPTGNMPLADHDHVTKGGTLGTDSVGTTQITDLSVTTGKINTGAVTLAKMAANSVDSDQYVDGSIDTVHLADDAVIPTKASGLSGASAAFVTQTASDTFASIDYTLSANRPLIYDGSDIRNQYIEIVNGGSEITTSGTTPSTVDTSSDLASIQNSSTLRLRMVSHLMLGASVAGDRYRFQWQYNYDNASSEDWQAYYNTDITFDAASSFKTVSLGIVFVGSSMTTQTWGFGGVYKVRLQVFRWAGTGALTIYSGGAGNYARQTVWEELVQ